MIALSANLPAGWKMIPLIELCRINPPKPRGFERDTGRETTFIPMEAVDDTTGAVIKPRIRPYQEVAKGYTYFEEGDVIFAKITPCMQNGKIAIVTNLIDRLGFGSTEFHVLRAKPGVDSRWIYYLARSAEFRRKAETNFEGSAGQRRVPDSFLKHIHVPFAESEKTQVEVLASLDSRMSQLYEMLRAAERQREAIAVFELSQLRERFDKPATNSWKKVRLSDMADVIMGQSPDGVTYNKNGQGTPLLNGPTEFTENHPVPAQWTTAPRKLGQPGDLLLCVRGNTTGRMNWADQIYALGRGVAGIRGKREKGDTPFVRQAIRYRLSKLLSGSERSTFPNIGKDEIGNFEFYAPSTVTEQEKFAFELDIRLARVKVLAGAAERQLEAVSALPAAMLREFFSFGSAENG